MEALRLRASLGVEFRGVDASRRIDDADFAKLEAGWLAHGLAVLRDQRLDERALVALSRRFGELEPPPASASRTRGESGSAVCPEVWVISNAVEGGALGAGEAEWHSDMSYLEEPPAASLLYAREVPPRGGNTVFADMVAALEALPPRLRAKIEGLRARHDSSYTSAGELRSGAAPVTDPTRAPGAEHPIVRTHPVTGRRALYLGRRRNGWIVGLPLEESERLLDGLWSFCTRPEFAYEHRWRPGDLLIWDNRSVIHRRDAFDRAARRVMLRTQVRGTAPF